MKADFNLKLDCFNQNWLISRPFCSKEETTTYHWFENLSALVTFMMFHYTYCDHVSNVSEFFTIYQLVRGTRVYCCRAWIRRLLLPAMCTHIYFSMMLAIFHENPRTSYELDCEASLRWSSTTLLPWTYFHDLEQFETKICHKKSFLLIKSTNFWENFRKNYKNSKSQLLRGFFGVVWGVLLDGFFNANPGSAGQNSHTTFTNKLCYCKSYISSYILLNLKTGWLFDKKTEELRSYLDKIG